MGERGTEELRTTEWLFALFSLACYVSFVSSVLTGASSSFPATGRYPPTWGVQVTLLVGLSFFGTVLFLRTRSLTLRCLVLASQTFFLLILLIPAQGGLTGESLILVVLVSQSGIYLPTRIHLGVSTVVIVLSAVFGGWIPTHAWFGTHLEPTSIAAVFSLAILGCVAAITAAVIRSAVLSVDPLK